jgi:hypothetical protein
MNDTVILPRAATHPRAGQRMSGAEMIVQVLADEGVSAIFGYSGGAILPTYDAVFVYNEQRSAAGEKQMPLYVPANEQGAGFMAAGYARASGRVGVCLVTSGPGATNTVTPVRDCMADSVPIVVICGQVPTGAIGTDAFQEAPVPSIMGAVAKHIFLVTDPKKLEATLRTAFEIARTGRPGPVVVDVPKDVQTWEGEFVGAARCRCRVIGVGCRSLPTRRSPPRGGEILRDAGEGVPATDLRRRRGDQRRRGRGARRVRARLRHPGRDYPHGDRLVRYDAAVGNAHARHARRRVRELRRGRLRFPDRRGCAI